MNKYNVIIIHENVLQAHGIAKLMNDFFSIKPIVLCEFDMQLELSEFDIIFISSYIYILHNNQVIPHKHKILIISDNIKFGYDTNNIISGAWTEEQIVSKINELINNIPDYKSSQNELSKREIEVLKLIVKGYLNKEIANDLNISINTVLTHRKNITTKLGIKSVSGLSVYAMMNGLI